MTIDACVAEWDRMVREGYYYDNSGMRCAPDPHKGRDCSTFAAAGLNVGGAGINPCSNSFSLAAWCYETERPEWFIERFGQGQGTYISYDQAQTVVNLGFRGSDFGRRPDYTGDGHVECILGQGKRSVGAHSHATGIGYDEDGLDTHQLQWFAIPPSFLEQMGTVPTDAATLEAIKKLTEWRQRVTDSPLRYGQTNGDVTILNNLLINRHLLNRNRKSNTYGRATRRAVNHLKRLHPEIGNIDGGMFGSKAADAILGL